MGQSYTPFMFIVMQSCFSVQPQIWVVVYPHPCESKYA